MVASQSRANVFSKLLASFTALTLPGTVVYFLILARLSVISLPFIFKNGSSFFQC